MTIEDQIENFMKQWPSIRDLLSLNCYKTYDTPLVPAIQKVIDSNEFIFGYPFCKYLDLYGVYNFIKTLPLELVATSPYRWIRESIKNNE